MDKKQGFFASLKNDVVRGLSPSRSRTTSPFWRKKTKHASESNHTSTLMPVLEGPDLQDSKRVGSGLTQWVKHQLMKTTTPLYFRADFRLLLGVMGAPLAPLHVNATHHLPLLTLKDTPIETSSAQYILQQYTAATGGQKVQNSIYNAYAMGKVRMVTSEFETATKMVKNRNARSAESGGFVLWQMDPGMWYFELAVGGSKIHAGCNGKVVWRHTPWLGSNTAKGPVRPLRRALQGLDPRTIAIMFSDAICIGERSINGEECFVLRLCADPKTLKARSEGPAEVIRHVLFGYFSQRTGLLVHIEDSHLTRVHSSSGDVLYWETTINSYLDDYRPVEGIMIAHSGRSVVTLFRFGEMAMSHTKTKMEEAWTIEEVAFNVPGLSVECFIPPADLKSGPFSDAFEFSEDDGGKNAIALAAYQAKVAPFEKSRNSNAGNMLWKIKI